MTDRGVHIATTVPVSFLAVAVGYHPVIVVPLVIGVLLPEVDTVDKRIHRSWLFHTFFVPSVVYAGLDRAGVLVEPLAVFLHFITLGMALHLLADFVYPRRMSNPGAGWPVRPALVATPWGLLWLGVAWTVQWFIYLSPEFIPWVVGYGS